MNQPQEIIYNCISRKCGKELSDAEIKNHQILCNDCSFLAKHEGNKKPKQYFEIEINQYEQEKSKRGIENKVHRSFKRIDFAINKKVPAIQTH